MRFIFQYSRVKIVEEDVSWLVIHGTCNAFGDGTF